MPNFKKTFGNTAFRGFLQQNTGSTVIIVAVVLVVLIGILMVTVDLSRMQSGSTNNQAAIDASTLAAAEYIARYRLVHNNQGDPGDINDYARNALLTNLSNDQSDAVLASNSTPDFVVTVDNSSVSIAACLTIKTGFAGSISQGENHKVCNTSKASLPGAGNVEIVFALDASTSMLDTCSTCGGQTKIAALRDSVKNLMNYYSSYNNIYWGVVPYTGAVDLGKMAPNIVDNDLSSGTPSHELATGSEAIFYLTYEGNPPPAEAKYNFYFEAVEDQYEYGGGSQFQSFNDGDPYNPDDALMSLRRMPLTSRQGNDHPEDPASISFDDAPPDNGHKFQSYSHHPYDFYIMYDADYDSSNANNQACGTCVDKDVYKYTYTTGGNTGSSNQCQSDFYNQCQDPGASHSDCGGGGGPSGPPVGPGAG